MFTGYSFTSSAKSIFPYMPYLGIIVFVIALIYTVYMVYNRDYIDRGLKLVNIGTEYIRENEKIALVSVVLFLIWIILFIL